MTLALPSRAHVPGSGTRPDMAPLEAAKAAVPARVVAGDWEENVAYRYGWRLHEAGCYWEAHEVWEAVWLACAPNSREKVFLQAIIQLANARLKQRMARPAAARRLFAEAYRLLAELPATADFMGCSPDRLRQEAKNEL
jgi:hypothetical protein